MAQSRQTPRVWSNAIRGSEMLANWVKLGSSAVTLSDIRTNCVPSSPRFWSDQPRRALRSWSERHLDQIPKHREARQHDDQNRAERLIDHKSQKK